MMTLISDYITSRSGNISLLNLDIRQWLTANDYYEVQLTDKYKHRIDLLAKDILGDQKLYFFILFLNDIKSFDDVEPDAILKIPTNDFINRYRYQMKIVRGIL